MLHLHCLLDLCHMIQSQILLPDKFMEVFLHAKAFAGLTNNVWPSLSRHVSYDMWYRILFSIAIQNRTHESTRMNNCYKPFISLVAWLFAVHNLSSSPNKSSTSSWWRSAIAHRIRSFSNHLQALTQCGAPAARATTTNLRDALVGSLTPIGIGKEHMMLRTAGRGGKTILLAENESWSQILGEKVQQKNYWGGRGPVST